MKRCFLLIFAVFCVFVVDASQYQTINGRNRLPLYRVRVPEAWIREETQGDLADTKLPICTFYIEENEERIRITIHNFPSQTIDDRIPPQAQIARWKGQIEGLEERDVSVIPQSFSGYVGFLFEGKGVMGWSMQLGAEQYRNLDLPEQHADVTIKATGDSVKKERHKIYEFARSFELIEEIPL